jgi:flagellar biosynthetic protein FliR
MPMPAKFLFAFAVSLMLAASGAVGAPEAAGPMDLAAIILKEFLVGLAMGFSIYLMFSLVLFMGQLIDYQIGFSMVSVFDPVTQIQAPVTGNLLYLGACAMMVQSGGLNALVALICRSFACIPVGQARILGNQPLLAGLIEPLASLLMLAARLSLPAVGAMLIVDVAMGLLVKAVPQMNVFVVGMPIKLLAGLALLHALTPLASSMYGTVFGEAYMRALASLEAMAP